MQLCYGEENKQAICMCQKEPLVLLVKEPKKHQLACLTD